MRSRLGPVTLMLCALAISGCAYLRVPQIDPTGERVFATPPVATTPQYRAEPGPELPGDDVAVRLSPQVTVAPVGSEVVLLAGVRGGDGYLRTNRRLEWSLAPGGVGHFVAVGRNGPIDWLLGDFNRPRKIDNTFAIGSTSRKYVHLNRGTPTTTDDVCVLRGQGWITLSSPVEGTSHVAVYAPEVYAWDSRTEAATIHWVDAECGFPPPAINPAGSTHTFTTTVTRQTDRCPCVGWLVRYQILDGPAAGFAPDGARSVEVATDAAGQASVGIFQKEPGPGTNKIGIQVIRPAALGGSDGKRLLVGNGHTLKTWTSPDLAVRKTGPATAVVGATLSYAIEVCNPGDLPAEEVLVSDELPEALTYLDGSPPAEVTGRKLRWRLERLGAGESRRLQLNCRAAAVGSVTNCAEATAAGGLKASSSATTTVMAPTLDVRVTGPTRATVGSEVTFEISITNCSQVPLTNLVIKDKFDPGLEHAAAEESIEADLGELAPGESRRIRVTFRLTKAGRLCHTVEVTGTEGIRASAQGCVTAIEGAAGGPRPQPTAPPSVSIKKTGPQEGTVGETAQFTIEITNTGSQMLSNLKVVDSYHPSLDPLKATLGFEFEDNKLVCTIDSLAAGEKKQLDVLYRCLNPASQASNRVMVTTQEGAQAEDESWLEIRAAASSLNMTVGDRHDPVTKGKELTYVIRVSNQGQTSDTQVTVEATVPVGMMPVALGSSGPGLTKFTIERQTVRFEPVAEIRPGESLTYRVRVLTRLPGELTFRAELTSQNLPQPLSVEETTEVFE